MAVLTFSGVLLLEAGGIVHPGRRQCIEQSVKGARARGSELDDHCQKSLPSLLIGGASGRLTLTGEVSSRIDPELDQSRQWITVAEGRLGDATVNCSDVVDESG